MDGIVLTDEEEKLKDEIERNLNVVCNALKSKCADNTDECKEHLSRMGECAHSLHMSLKSRGYEPKHHRYMIENRVLKPDDKNFYMHIHPVEDLLAFIDDIHANDDPGDQTINEEFKLKIYSRRWGHYDVYKMKRVSTGWDIYYFEKMKCDKQGRSIYDHGRDIFTKFNSDLVNYPHALDQYFEYLWYQAEEAGLTYDEVQKAIDDLGKWISTCEINSPKGIFEVYK